MNLSIDHCEKCLQNLKFIKVKMPSIHPSLLFWVAESIQGSTLNRHTVHLMGHQKCS